MRTRRIIVVGAAGRLGAALVRHFGAGHDVIGLTRPGIDLGSADSIRAVLAPLRYDLLFNAAALTAVDHCETHEEEAMVINARAVGLMGEICREKRARMIHFSTDYVFDGNATAPYTEADPPAPLSVYARSKLAGESALLAASPDHLAVRVSWLFGPDRPSFIDWLVSDAMDNDDVAAIADKISTPTYSIDLTRNIEALVRLDFPGGVLHLPNSGSCSWQQYGQAALDMAAGCGLTLRATRVRPVLLAQMTRFVARRPVYTPLSPALFTRLTGIEPRRWQEALLDHVREHMVPRIKRGIRDQPSGG